MKDIRVPFFQVSVSDDEIDNVVATLRSGWLTSGPRVREFEDAFAEAVGATHAIAVSSCTAAMHLALEALQVRPQQTVLVPTMTFAATAEVVLYMGAFPLLVDCDSTSTHMSFDDAQTKLDQLRSSKLPAAAMPETSVVGIVPVHVGGKMVDMKALNQFASAEDLWIVEDAAHAFPASWREEPNAEWQSCGQSTANVSCFSFYANKTVTTGEGGMAVTEDADLANRMRLMSLHGLQYAPDKVSWSYRIAAPGFKYNMTDVAAALGIGQLARAEEMRVERERIALRYIEGLSDVKEIELPLLDTNRVHAWHLFQIKLQLHQLRICRDQFISELSESGISCSVHWRPLHLHPYYQKTFGWRAEDFPNATELWERLVSLPLFPTMSECQIDHVIRTIRGLCKRYAR